MVVELHLIGAKADRPDVGDVVGDRVEPPLQRDLSGERDIEAESMAQDPPSFRFCRPRRRSARSRLASAGRSGSGRGDIAQAFSNSQRLVKRVRNLVELLPDPSGPRCRACSRSVRPACRCLRSRSPAGYAERRLHDLQQRRIGQNIVGLVDLRRLALEVEREPNAFVLRAGILLQRLPHIIVDRALLRAAEDGRRRRRSGRS